MQKNKIINNALKKVLYSEKNTIAIKEFLKEQVSQSFFFFAHDVLSIKSSETGRPIVHEDPHKEVCDAFTTLAKNVMVLLPREFGKTFITELFIIWYIIHNPNKTVLLFSATQQKAEEIVSAIKLIMNGNEDFISLYGNSLFTKKRNKRFEICLKTRTTTDKEPNLLAFGIENSIQGYRGDVIIYEDIIGDDYIFSSKTQRAINDAFFNATRPLLKKTGTRIYIGTRYHFDDIPGLIINDPIKRKSWHIISKSIENANGNSAFPHIVSNEQLRIIRDDIKSNAYYSSQYLNSPRNEGDAAFEPNKYINEHGYSELPSIAKYIMALDLATSTNKTSDDRALVVVGLGHNGYMYLVDAYSSNTIKAKRFYDKIAEYYKKYNPQRVLIETNNAEALYQQYKEISVERKDYIPFKPIKHTQHKEERIITLEYLLATGYLRLPANYKNNKYLKKLIDVEMEFFVTTSKTNKDDSLDALETAIQEIKKVKKLINSNISVINTREYDDGNIW